MRRAVLYLLIFLGLLIAPFAWRYFNYYGVRGGSHNPPANYAAGEVAQLVPTPATAVEFNDNPRVGDSLVLLDMSHDNDFTMQEIGFLDERLAARGAEFVPFLGGDLANALRPANSFVVMTPLKSFELEEIQAVEAFVARGGKLLLVGDPGRFNTQFIEDEFGFLAGIEVDTDRIPLNSLANAFNISFNNDYLYNLEENEGNFKNIILRPEGFADSDVMTGVDKLAFYGSHSLTVGRDGQALMTADENTWSSATDRPGGLALAVTSHEDRVLALGDIHFVIAPYYTVFDNRQLIAGISDFLTDPRQSDRTLADFPFLYNQPVDLIYMGSPDLGPNAFDEVITLQNSFASVGQELTLATEPNGNRDVLYVGLYNDSDEVVRVLANAGISLTIDPPVLTEAELADIEEETAAEDEEAEVSDTGDDEEADTPEIVRQLHTRLGNIQMGGTALILLHQNGPQRQVIVLAASNEGLENTIGRLTELISLNAETALSDCLLQDSMALCPTDVSNEEVEAELITGGEPEPAASNDDEDEEPAADPEDDEGEDPTDEPEDNGGGVEPDFDAIEAEDKGTIGIGDTVEGELAGEERHGYVLTDSNVFVNIAVETSAEEMDLVLEVFDATGELVRSADSGFDGEGESINGLELPANDTYVIVVSNFFGNEGDYTLTVEESAVQGGIFIYADDNDDAETSGYTSAQLFADLLSDEGYDVTVWIASEEDVLTTTDVAGYEMLIWTSGDHRALSAFEGEDDSVLFDNFILANDSRAFLVGATPAVFASNDLATLVDIEVADEDTPLLDGFVAGDTYELTESVNAVLIEITEEDRDEGDFFLFLRGENSDSPGEYVAFGVDNPDDGSKLVVFVAPYTLLPEEVQTQFLANVLNWMGLAD